MKSRTTRKRARVCSTRRYADTVLRDRCAYIRHLAVEPLESRWLLALTFYVDDNAAQDHCPGDVACGDPFENGTDIHPFDAIQEAIDRASNGDTVIVLRGTYTGTGNRDIDFGGRSITVRGTDPDDPTVVAETIVDVQGTRSNKHRGFYFHRGEDSKAVVSGLTIHGGYHDQGGAIYCSSASPTLTKNLISENRALQDGGAIYIRRGQPTVSDNIIVDNRTGSGRGGGIYADRSGVGMVVADNTIQDNRANAGGGVFLQSATDALLDGNRILRNMAGSGGGGGVYIAAGSAVLRQNTVSENQARNSSGGGVQAIDVSSVTIEESTIDGNSAVDGGGFFATRGAQVTVKDSTVSDNTADRHGGGLNLGYSDVVTVENSTISGNQTSSYGGGMTMPGSALVSVLGNIITDNTAENGGGGGIDVWGAELSLTDNLVQGNSAVLGAGIAVRNDCTATIEENQILQNVATNGNGGGINVQGSWAAIAENVIRGNSSTNGGGGIYLRDWTQSVIERNQIVKNVTETGDGGGILAQNYTMAVVLNNWIEENSSEQRRGGGIHFGTAWGLVQGNILRNNLSAQDGSAIAAYRESPWIVNNVIYADADHPEVNRRIAQFHAIDGSAPLLLHNVIWGPMPSATVSWGAQLHMFYNDTSDGQQANRNGNLQREPRFIDPADPLGPDGVLGTVDDGFRLLPDSPLVDAGHPSFLDEDDTPSDIGAYGDIVSRVTADTIHVGPDTAVEPRNGTEFQPYEHIWEALLAADPGAEIQVRPGRYDENLVIWKDGISLVGAGADRCTLRGNSQTPGRSGRLLTLWYADDVDFSGFTLTRGDANNGGAVESVNASATLHDNRMVANVAGVGAAISSVHSDLQILDNVMEDNETTWDGGAIWVAAGSEQMVIEGNRFVDNRGRDGAAVFFGVDSVIRNNLFANNTASRRGGAIFSYARNSSQIVNNTLSGNAAGESGAALYVASNTTATIRNSIFWDNTATNRREMAQIAGESGSLVRVSYSDIQGGESGVAGDRVSWRDGNIDVGPLFADPQGGDFHLKSVNGRWDTDGRDIDGNRAGAWIVDSYHSPAIDRGDPADSDGDPLPFLEPAPHGDLINMGAYGGTEEASMSSPAPRIEWVALVPGDSLPGDYDVNGGVARIELRFDTLMEPASLWPEVFRLLASGGDGTFDDGNEVSWAVADVLWDAETYTTTLVLDVPCGSLPRETYQLTAFDDLRSATGRRLDGEFDGTFPTGDAERWEGGDFSIPFTVRNAPPVAYDDHASLLQAESVELTLHAGDHGCDADGDALLFQIVEGPSHGTLTRGLGEADWVYQPAPDWFGEDQFQFVANDGRATSDPATFRLVVASVPADFEPRSLGLDGPPADPHMGQGITVQWTVANHGPGGTVSVSVADWIDQIYLSADDQLDYGEDVLLCTWGAEQAPQPGAGEEYHATCTAVLSHDREWSGQYYLILEVNADARQAETTYENNVLAQSIELSPYIELTRPYCGRFADRHSRLGFQWHDVDQEYSATIDLLAGDGHGRQWTLATGIAEDNESDQYQVFLPAEMTPRAEPYYVWATLSNASGYSTESARVPIRVFDQVFYSDEPLGDAFGGLEYETLGIEAGLLAGVVHYRVLTNYSRMQFGGALYINVGGTWQEGGGIVHGIALNDQTGLRTPTLVAGDLYTGASFRGGTVASGRPTFIVDWTEHVSGVSSLEILSPPCLPWSHAIEGYFYPAALPGYEQQTLQIAWSKICGNDIADVVIPGLDSLRVLAMEPDPECQDPPVNEHPERITVSFNNDVDPTSINESTFQVWDVGADQRYGTADDAPVTGSATYNPVTWRASFVPEDDFQTGHTYAAVLIDNMSEQSLYFDGVDAYLTTDMNLNQGPTSSGTTFEAWVKPRSTSVGEHHVISTDNGGYDWSLLRIGNRWGVFTGSRVWNTGLTVDLRVWQHIAVTFTPDGTVAFYKNGTEKQGPTVGFDRADSDVTIGRRSSSRDGYFAGTIDDVRVWGIPRTAEEIRESMHRATTGLEPGLLGYWDFEDGEGQVADNKVLGQSDAVLGRSANEGGDDPKWTSSEIVVGGVIDREGKPLDGEFDCRFPSGDGVPGGDYVALVAVGQSYPRVVGMTPFPGQPVAPDVGVDTITLQFSAIMEPVTLYAPNFQLLGSGGDGDFADGNEVGWTVTDVSWNEATYTATLTIESGCSYLPGDTYRLTVSDDLQSTSGLGLDGEFPAAGTVADFPSGDGAEGGDFVAVFEVLNAPPVAQRTQRPVTVRQNSENNVLPPLVACDADSLPGLFEGVFRIVSKPRHGTLKLVSPQDTSRWLYTPNPGYVGPDSFQFVAHDLVIGATTSNRAQFDIRVVEDYLDLEPVSPLVVDTSQGFHMGDSIRVSWTGINHGAGTTVGSWEDRVYLSANDQLDVNRDVHLCSFNATEVPVPPGEDYRASCRATLPEDLEWSGAYHLIVHVNANGSQLEQSADRANNTLAMPIEIDPFVKILDRYDDRVTDDLLTLYDGRFVDRHTPLTIVWTDVDQRHDAEISFFVDDGAGQRWRIEDGIEESADGPNDTYEVRLPSQLTPRLEPYYVVPILTNVDGLYEGEHMPIRLLERAFVTDDPLGDTEGGEHFEVHGIEAGVLGDNIYYRVRTDFNPRNSGGDVYLNIGGTWEDRHQSAEEGWIEGSGTAHAIAVSRHGTAGPAALVVGDLYTQASFSPGTVVLPPPYRIVDWDGHVANVSAATVETRSDVAWRYEIDGHVDRRALPGDVEKGVQFAWTMYCGNDIAEVTARMDPEILMADVNGDGFASGADIDVLFAKLAAGGNDLRLDLDDSEAFDRSDVDFLVVNLLRSTFGDSNLDGLFNRDDLLQVLTAGEFADEVAGNSTWQTGDWNGDQEFDNLDLVLSLQDGRYAG